MLTNVVFAQEEEDRNAEYARRSLGLSIAPSAEPDGTKTSTAPQLGIAMLVKDPTLKPLRSFIQYHYYLGIRYFVGHVLCLQYRCRACRASA